MKGCLKLNPVDSGRHTPTNTTPSNTSDAASTTPTQAHTQTHRKCVAFCGDGSETVHTADEWDRTPAQPAPKLSYEELLELEEIQRSLPRANQPLDTFTGRPGKQFLSRVPIVLLPLLSSSPSPSRGDSSGGVYGVEAKKPYHFSDLQGRTNGYGTTWGLPV